MRTSVCSSRTFLAFSLLFLFTSSLCVSAVWVKTREEREAEARYRILRRDSGESAAQPFLDRLTSDRVAMISPAFVVYLKANFEKEYRSLSSAIPLYFDAIRLEPSMWIAWKEVGLCLFEEGKKEQASIALMSAVQLEPEPSFHSAMVLATALNANNKLERAIVYYTHAVNLDNNATSAWYDLSLTLSTMGENEKAEKAARRAQYLEPNTANTNYLLGNALMNAGKYDAALLSFENALRINPNDAGVFHNAAHCLLMLEREEAAVKPFARALQLAPANALHVVGMGNALRRGHRFTAFRAVLNLIKQPKLGAFVLPSSSSPISSPTSASSEVLNDHISVNTSLLHHTMTQLLSNSIEEEGWGEVIQRRQAVAERGWQKENGVIIYLISTKRAHYLELCDSLHLLFKHFLLIYPGYDVVIFHEGLTQAEKDGLRRCANGGNVEEDPPPFLHPFTPTLLFQHVHFSLPPFVDEREVPKQYFHASVGYRHMCRFFGGKVFDQPILSQYDYFWRLDSDSYLLSPLPLDVFGVMSGREEEGEEEREEEREEGGEEEREEKNGRKGGGYDYGFLGIGREDESVAVGLWDVVKEYMAENNMAATPLLERFATRTSTGELEWDRSYFYTNFEVGSLSFFRSPSFVHFFDYLDRKKGIYKYRWGDAPIHLLAVSLLSDHDRIVRFKSVAYAHKAFVNLPLSD